MTDSAAQDARRKKIDLLPCFKCDVQPLIETSLGGLVCKIWCPKCGFDVFECTIGIVDKYADEMAADEWNRRMLIERT